MFECPYCATTLETGTEHCPVCDENLIVCRLTCVFSGGRIRKSDSEPLYPGTYIVSEDEIVHSRGLDPAMGKSVKLIYRDGFFHFQDYFLQDGHYRMRLKKLNHRDKVMSGESVFEIDYVKNFAEYNRDTAEAFKRTASAITSLNFINDPLQLYDFILDTLLRITRLEKAYYFSATPSGADYVLSAMAGRSSKMKDLDTRFFPMSVSTLKNAVNSDGKILIVDAQTTTHLTDSVSKFKLQSIVTCPVRTADRKLVGILYADSIHRIERASLFEFRPLIRMFSLTAAERIEKLESQFNLMNSSEHPGAVRSQL